MVTNDLYPPTALQSPVFWSNLTASEDIVINQGGTWSGKSYSIMMVLFYFAVTQKDWIITVVSNTVPKLKEDAMRIARAIINDNVHLQRAIKDFNQSDRIYTFRSGSIIEFKSFETGEQAKGGKRHILYINEATRIPFNVFFEAQLRTSVRTFIDYNPTATFWAHNRVIHNKKEYTSVKVIRSWHEHNPYLPAKMHERIENIQDPEQWKVYARGLTGKLQGTVFPNFVEVPNDFSMFGDGTIWGIDWGYTNDPTAALRIAALPKGHKFDYIFDELCYTPGIPIPTLAGIMKENGYKRGQLAYCDHDRTQIYELRKEKIDSVPFVKGPGSLNAGILYLRNKRVGYTQRSFNLAVEAINYTFMEVDTSQGTLFSNEPKDEYNHLMDAGRGATYTQSLRKRAA